MKKMLRLDLSDLKVKSFVTSLNDEEKKKAYGRGPGFTGTNCLECLPSEPECPSDPSLCGTCQSVCYICGSEPEPSCTCPTTDPTPLSCYETCIGMTC
jgi:hypothetical protein